MNKEDIVLFGMFKGKTWDDLLLDHNGTVWGDWWSGTQSKGAYANRENKMKSIWREWRGLEPIDTRKLTIGLNSKELYEKLDRIEAKLDSLIEEQKEPDEEWTHEA